MLLTWFYVLCRIPVQPKQQILNLTRRALQITVQMKMPEGNFLGIKVQHFSNIILRYRVFSVSSNHTYIYYYIYI